MDLHEMDKKINKLQKFAQLEGSETGEVCHALIRLAQYPSYMSDELREALAVEIDDQLQWFEDHYKIIEREKIIKKRFTELEEIEY